METLHKALKRLNRHIKTCEINRE